MLSRPRRCRIPPHLHDISRRRPSMDGTYITYGDFTGKSRTNFPGRTRRRRRHWLEVCCGLRIADCGLRSADSVARRRRSIRARVRDPIAHRLERREQAALELLADRSHPLLGTLGAALGLRELDLEVLELVGELTANVAEALVRFAFGLKDALIRFAVDAFDARLGGGGVLSCARELRLEVTKLLLDFTVCATEDVLCVGLGVGDAVIRLRPDPRDTCVGF